MKPRYLQSDYTTPLQRTKVRCEDFGLEFALRYADIGIPVYPCAEGSKSPFDGGHCCSTPHKHGYNDATLDPRTIECWWGKEHPYANIGGMPSRARLIVCDFDRREGGGELLKKLSKRLGNKTFLTPTVITFDGWHFWFALPEDLSIENLSLPKMCGIDIFGPKGFGRPGGVLLPYSYRSDKGHTYCWQEGLSIFELPPLPLPIELIDTLRELFPAKELRPAPPPKSRRSADEPKEVGWLAEYDRDPALVRDLLNAMQCRDYSEPSKEFHFCTPLRSDDNHKSGSFKRFGDGLFKYHDFKYPGLYLTPAHVWASWISGAPIEDVYTIKGPSLACWKIRLLIRLGRLEEPRLELPLLPGNPPRSASNVYRGFELLLRCRMAYNKTDKAAPAPLSYRFAQSWTGITEKAARYGVIWLLKNGHLRLVGRENGVNLYWPTALD